LPLSKQRIEQPLTNTALEQLAMVVDLKRNSIVRKTCPLHFNLVVAIHALNARISAKKSIYQ
jgi:hypothetical protein